MNYADVFASGLDYASFLAKFGTEDQKRRWAGVHQKVALTDAQRTLIHSFKRTMPVLVLAGAWCGDCVDQCPIFDHIARETSVIEFRYFDRDASPDLATQLRICGGARVPSVLFLSEDFQEVGRYGDRTLARYRQIFEKTTGASCSTGLVTDLSLLSAVTQEWIDQIERAQLILRTSPRLREKHGD